MNVRSRSLGIIFIAAVIVPSILLAVISMRSAGREEAYMEKQMVSTLDAEVTQTASLASAEVVRITDELRSVLDVPLGGDYGRILARCKSTTALVSVPFMLSSRYGLLWPPSDARADTEQKRFLSENGPFLSDRTATTVFQNIAVRYREEILAQTSFTQKSAAVPQRRAQNAPPQAAGDTERAARPNSVPLPSASSAPDRVTASQVAAKDQAVPAAESSVRQMAIDAFAQSPSIQSRVYEEASEKGDQLNSRVVEPMALSQPAGAMTAGKPQTIGGATEKSVPAKAALSGEVDNPAGAQRRPRDAPEQQLSQFVLTSQLFSQIASRGDSGLIPRFVGEKLVFLFWERQKDGRIVGCELASGAFRSRIASVLTSTWSQVRILTLLDENGTPLAAPPGAAGHDWRRPFVAREIGESLPRWEAAAYLTRADSISSRARSSSLVIWIMVVILFVCVTSGGTMVLSTVYGEMKLAQQKSTFVTNVSHELKTPLTSISLFIDLLRKKGTLPQSKKEQYLSLMASETERLTRLINNILDFSRDSSARRYSIRTVDVTKVVWQVTESQRVRLESKGFKLLVPTAGEGAADCTPQVANVRADTEALKQALLNLLSNAEKYSVARKEIVVGVARESESVLITVGDRGIGIPEQDREKVFQAFYRVDDSLSSGIQGTGLGLTIARRIVRDLGGDLVCKPRRGGGTDFVVQLPAVDGVEGLT
jgi:signal transduction histidine kinase